MGASESGRGGRAARRPKMAAWALAWVIGRPGLGGDGAKRALAVGKALGDRQEEARGAMARMALVGALALAGKALLRAAPDRGWARAAAAALIRRAGDPAAERAFRERRRLDVAILPAQAASRGPARL